MKKLKIAMLTGCLACLPITQVSQAKITAVGAPAQRQVPSEESVRRLLQVLQFDKGLNQQLEQSKNMATQSLQPMLKDTLQDVQLTPTQLQQIELATNDFLQKMIDEQNQPALRQKMIQVYQETLKDNYSQDEVDAMISFYGSPVGQSIVNKQSIVSQAYSNKVMPIMLETTQTTLKKLLPSYQQKITSIVTSSSKK